MKVFLQLLCCFPNLTRKPTDSSQDDAKSDIDEALRVHQISQMMLTVPASNVSVPLDVVKRTLSKVEARDFDPPTTSIRDWSERPILPEPDQILLVIFVNVNAPCNEAEDVKDEETVNPPESEDVAFEPPEIVATDPR
ncbi:hypothetical protein [Caudoviricetes sp.]|nr:hypothetical protein [Caudoviricetes sp.]